MPLQYKGATSYYSNLSPHLYIHTYLSVLRIAPFFVHCMMTELAAEEGRMVQCSLAL